MLFQFLYPDVPAVEIPDKNLLGVFEPNEIELGPGTDEEVIKEGLANPIGTPRIREMVKKGQKVVIVVDDNTRLTPIDRIVPYVVEELTVGGINHKDVCILIGYGTHRLMTMEEKRKKYGALLDRFTFIDHDFRIADMLTYIGKTSLGTEIYVNKHVVDADFVIGMGHIVPHKVAGFGGGAKLIQPAVCGEITTGQTHWLSAAYSGKEIMGVADNPVRLEMEAVARKVGLNVIVNAVQDRKGKVVKLVVGDLVEAHRAGIEWTLKVFGVKIPGLADIVLTDSYPADIEMWQAAKGMYMADLAVKDDGVIILVTPCREGVAGQHPEVLEYGYRPYHEVEQILREGKIKDLTAAAHLVHVGEIIKKCKRCFLVSSGIKPDAAAKLGFTWAATPAEALREAFKLKGDEATVLAFRHAGEILPITG